MNPQQETQVRHIEQRALSLPDRARTLTITDQRTYDIAAATLRDVVTTRKEITDHHGPLKKTAHDAHQAVCDAEAKLLKPVAEAERIIKLGIGNYEREQMRIQEEQRLAAKRVAEEEQEALRKQQIQEAEATVARSIDVALEEAETFEEACAITDAREGVLADARQEAKSEPLPPISYSVEPTIFRHPGVSPIISYMVEVEDIKELCQAVADGNVPPELILPNMPALNKIAKALKKHFSIPGCKVVQVNNVRARPFPTFTVPRNCQ